MPFPTLPRFIPLAVVLVLGACVDFTGLDIAGGHLLSISVDNGVVEVGDTVRLTAAGNVDGIVGILSYDPVLDARWAVSDSAIALVQALPLPPPEDSFPRARALIRGRRPGAVTVTATARGKSGEATVRVIPVVVTIQVRAARYTLTVGDTIVVTAAALDAGGLPISGVPLTFEVGGGAQLSGLDDTSARVVAITAGPATISVRFRRATGVAALVVLSPGP